MLNFCIFGAKIFEIFKNLRQHLGQLFKIQNTMNFNANKNAY